MNPAGGAYIILPYKEVVIGVVNVQGRIIPVVDIRKRFRLLKREINLNNKFIL
ncbi:MAG TPA: chemotaxis protein CheW [Candidatus Brocadiaceae bacterium]